MGGIIIGIEVDDRGTVKVKQFTDETKKAFDEMKKAPQEAARSLNSLRDSWVGVTAKIAVATAAFYGAKRLIYDTAKEMASFGSEIERISETMGMNISQFQEWRYVAKMTDVEFQSLTMGLRMLSQNMLDVSRGTGEAKNSFIRLGISVTNSDGSLKSINQMIPEIASKLSSITNPTEKLALTMEIFGSRSGEAFTALLRQGGPAIEAMIKEFNDLGFAIDEKWIQRLAESESSFKKLSFAGEKLKASFAPMVEEIAASMERMASYTSGFQKIADIMEEIAVVSKSISEQPWYMKMLPGIGDIVALKKVYADLDDLYKERAEKAQANFMSSTPSKWIADWVKNFKPDTGRGGGPLTFKDLYGMTEEELKDRMSISQLMYEDWEERNLAPVTFEDIYGITEEEFQDRMSISKLMYEDWKERNLAPVTFEDIYGMTEKEFQDRMSISKLMGEAWLESYTQVSDIEKAWTTLSENISSAWNFNVTGILRGTTSIKDAFKNMVDGMVDSFISSVSKMIMQWLLFGSITGKSESSGGFLYGGSWSGILGSIGKLFTAQEGFSGWVNKPTAFLAGEGGEREHIDITPESKMGKQAAGGDTYIINNYNQVNDPNTFERLYGPVVKKLSHQSAAEAKRYNKIGNRS